MYKIDIIWNDSVNKIQLIRNGQQICRSDILTPPQQITIKSTTDLDFQNPFYILYMIDPDAANPNRLHWIAANLIYDKMSQSLITNNQYSSIIAPYQPPSPPNNEVHRYIFLLFGMKHKIPYSDVEKYRHRFTRINSARSSFSPYKFSSLLKSSPSSKPIAVKFFYGSNESI